VSCCTDKLLSHTHTHTHTHMTSGIEGSLQSADSRQKQTETALSPSEHKDKQGFIISECKQRWRQLKLLSKVK